jgi:hypothetical protein
LIINKHIDDGKQKRRHPISIICVKLPVTALANRGLNMQVTNGPLFLEGIKAIR